MGTDRRAEARNSGSSSLCQRIISVFQRLTEDGGASNFVILSADEHHYVQFRSCCGSAVINGEAVSNRFLAAPFKLTARQQAQILRLGWRPPTRRKYPNFYRFWSVLTDRDRQAIAEVALATLDVYGWPSDRPFAVRGHLDGMDDDTFMDELAEALGLKPKTSALAPPEPEGDGREQGRARPLVIEDDTAAALGRREIGLVMIPADGVDPGRVFYVFSDGSTHEHTCGLRQGRAVCDCGEGDHP